MKRSHSLSLYSYQEKGVNAALFALRGPHAAFLLGDEMGLGKTIQALETRCRLTLDRPTLILCPSAVMHSVWAEGDLARYYGDQVDVRVFSGNTAVYNTLHEMTKDTLVITSYDLYRNAYKVYIDDRMRVSGLSADEMRRYLRVHSKRVPQSQSGLLAACASIYKAPKRVFKDERRLQGYRALLSAQWGLLILDEVHVIKNASSVTTRAVGFLDARRRMALSGTPIMNSAHELRSIFRYGLGLFGAKLDVKSLLSQLYLGRRKSEVKELSAVLPKRIKQDEVVLVSWNRHRLASREYVRIREIGRESYDKTVCLKRRVDEPLPEWRRRKISSVNDFFTYMQRLRQICIHPLLPHFMVDPGYGRENTQIMDPKKLMRWHPALHRNFTAWQSDRLFSFFLALRRAAPAVYRVLRNTLARWVVQQDMVYYIQPSAKMLFFRTLYKEQRGGKVIVVCSYRVFFDRIMSPWLARIGIRHAILCGGNKERQRESIRSFTEDSDVKVLLMVKSVGVTGHNFQDVASACVIMDPHYNEALDEQAAARIDRIGQNRQVCVRRLLMEGSIDEAFYVMQERKKEEVSKWLKNSRSKTGQMKMIGLHLSKTDTVKG